YRKGYVNVAMESSPGYMDGNLYISLLHKLIPRIADQDNVVIIGRGGQYILADRPDTFHFLMIASLTHRIEFIMEHYNLDNKQARIVVEKHAKRRLNLYRYFARIDYEKPELYHLVLNMNWLSLQEAVALVCQLVEHPIS
ncbi:MAG: cytidylate kinase-like family protein, partial [Desulfofustis sp.]